MLSEQSMFWLRHTILFPAVMFCLTTVGVAMLIDLCFSVAGFRKTPARLLTAGMCAAVIAVGALAGAAITVLLER